MCSSGVNESDVVSVEVEIANLIAFEGHPFKVERDLELYNLRESIEREGILNPLIVRKGKKNKFEIVSGHRRKEAAEWAGLTKVPVIIKELDDYQATIFMVDSNLQREKVLPSEKAYAYKMRLDAMKHQGKSISASDPMGPKINRSNEYLAKLVGESTSQIKRYIRVTNLILKILNMVDQGMIAVRTGAELSYLTEEEQYELYAVMDLEQCVANVSQANRLKRMSQQNTLTIDSIYEILCEEKPNQREQLKIPMDRVGKYFPKEYSVTQQLDLIEILLKKWADNK